MDGIRSPWDFRGAEFLYLQHLLIVVSSNVKTSPIYIIRSSADAADYGIFPDDLHAN